MHVGAAEALLDACLYEPERLPSALEEAGRLLDYAYFCLVAADLSAARFIASDRQREGIAAYFNGGWRDVDYRVHAENNMPLGSLYLDHIHADAAIRRNSTIYNELYGPRDMANYAGIRFEIDGQQWFCSASRGEAKGGIDGAEARAFVRAARTAMRSASVGARMERARVHGMLQSLEMAKLPAILLDETARVTDLTTAAGAFLDDEFNVREGRLQAAAAGDRAALEQLAAMARKRVSGGPATFIVYGRSHGRPIRIEASHVVGRGLDDLVGARLLLLLTDLGAGDRAFADEVSRRFRLSPAEADIVAHFAEGRSIKQIAARRHVAESTIREQMKSVYNKTGVHRQVDLLRLFNRLKP